MPSLFQTIRSLFLVDQPDSDAQVSLSYNQPAPNNEHGLVYKLKRYSVSRAEQDMKVWKRAVALAEHTMRPRRIELYKLYHRSMEDDHLLAQVRTARFTVQMAPFYIKRAGKKEDAESSTFFERPWFYEYLQHAIDSELYGHSLVEFHTTMKNGEFQKISLVPREHVRPEYSQVVLSIHDEQGLNYTQKPLNKYILPIGDPYDLGILKVASKLVIRKEYALTDWSRRNEKYGMPFLIVRTASRKDSELQAKEEMAASFGSNAYAILDDQDQVTMLESNQAFTFQSFQNYSDWADKAISTLINGQTGTMSEKSFVGSAEVHERVLNTYTKARMKRLQLHINYELIPFLTRHGYPLEGAEFIFSDLEDTQPTMTDTSDNDVPPAAPQKKKTELSVSNELSLMYEAPCCDEHNYAATSLSYDLRSVMDNTMRRVWENKVRSGELDQDSWAFFSQQLNNALAKGWGATLAQISYENATDWELMAQLRNNIFVFSAFKNHAAVADMAAELVDGAGNLREWKDYKAAVEQISANYFEDWLHAEYNTAVATGQTAVRWQQFQQNKDMLPFLQYVTQRDARVREAHKAIDGVTLRVDDSFWDTYYPPNGWNCRCDIIQTAGPEQKPTRALSEEQAPPLFRHNPAKTKELFPQSHPYFQTVPEPQRKRLLKAVSKLVYEQYDEAWQKIAYDDATGGYIVAHNTAGADLLGQNIAAAQNMLRKGDQVEILPGAETTPDLSRNGLLWATAQSETIDMLPAALNGAARRAQRLYVMLPSYDDALQARKTATEWLNSQQKVQSIELQLQTGDSFIVHKNLSTNETGN